MEKLSETVNTPSQDSRDSSHRQQRFKLSALEILFGSLIVIGLVYMGYFILFQESSGTVPQLEKKIKFLETSSLEQNVKTEQKIKALQDIQSQLESRLKSLEVQQKQLNNTNRELMAKAVKTEKGPVEAKKSLSGKEKIEYKVKKGETLSSIAKKFKVSREDLARWNKMDKNKSVLIGETLIIYPH